MGKDLKGKELGSTHIYGMVHGIEGLLNEELIKLEDYLDSDEKWSLTLSNESFIEEYRMTFADVVNKAKEDIDYLRGRMLK